MNKFRILEYLAYLHIHNAINSFGVERNCHVSIYLIGTFQIHYLFNVSFFRRKRAAPECGYECYDFAYQNKGICLQMTPALVLSARESLAMDHYLSKYLSVRDKLNLINHGYLMNKNTISHNSWEKHGIIMKRWLKVPTDKYRWAARVRIAGTGASWE